MKRILLLFAIILSTVLTAKAQLGGVGGGSSIVGKVAGTLVDSISKKPLDYASVSIFRATGTAPINGVLTDAAGTRDAYAKASDQVANAYKDLGSLLDGTFSSATSQVAGAYKDANSAITAAYQDTKTGNQRTLMIGALIVVALAVSMPFLAKEAA